MKKSDVMSGYSDVSSLTKKKGLHFVHGTAYNT